MDIFTRQLTMEQFLTLVALDRRLKTPMIPESGPQSEAQLLLYMQTHMPDLGVGLAMPAAEKQLYLFHIQQLWYKGMLKPQGYEVSPLGRQAVLHFQNLQAKGNWSF